MNNTIDGETAEECFKKGLIQKIEFYSKSIQLYPKHSLAYNNRWFAYNIKCQYDNAIDDFSKILCKYLLKLPKPYRYRL